ncbi:HigA family addiction module antitoxin [Lacticaseibacillus saniviri]|uniref:DNA-binding protein n=1 Tax=Lacticaseibacillus saniviri JCM 17471 = DSM 24301 TaxID=1293598 RepID=A0A0R2N0J5_9LACO|nr:HigA family addiction module antitoxin [Lacticaseibacillus saniviri]KRO16506.1 DNA-binding protein [Lacticaseibacillus saniviri JCM 17471 = DSM 24301]
MSRNPEYKDLIGFHPGNYVSDILDDMNITQEEFAHRLGLSGKTVSKLVNNEEGISPATANKLAQVTGVSIKTWLNLQAKYDAKVEEIRNLQSEDEANVAQQIDSSFLKEHHILENRRYPIREKIVKLRQILKMSNLTQLLDFNPQVSYRLAERKNKSKSRIASNVILQLAMNEASHISNVRYDKKKLEQKFTWIKQLNLKSPENFYPELRDGLLECGIVLVGMPNMPGAGLNGATKRFKNGSVLLLFTDKNKSADIIWFSIIHELGHIYYEDFFSDRDDQESYDEKEKKADRFAENFFIPEDKYSEFVSRKDFSPNSVVSFAKEMGVIPSIVIGRIRNDNLIDYQDRGLNSLGTKYEIVKDFSPI